MEARTEIEADGFRFSFPAGWEILKYDGYDWPYYDQELRHIRLRINSDAEIGIRAVDLVARGAGKLWLIEIKDYRKKSREKGETLEDEFARKIFDTLAGLALARFQATRQDDRNSARNFLVAQNLVAVLHLEGEPQPLRKIFGRPLRHRASLAQTTLPVFLRKLDFRLVCQGDPKDLPWRVASRPEASPS